MGGVREFNAGKWVWFRASMRAGNLLTVAV